MKRKPLWVNNSNWIRPDAQNNYEGRIDPVRLKAGAEQRMKWYDDLPLKTRKAVNEYGQLKAAAIAHYQGRNSLYACRNAYIRKMEISAVKLED